MPTQVDERRNQTRATLRMPARRARRWTAGAWHELEAEVTDLSSRGVGLRVNQMVRVGDRLSLVFVLFEAEPDLRVLVEVRHAREARSDDWRVGGLFKTISPADHERVVRYLFAQFQSRNRL